MNTKTLEERKEIICMTAIYLAVTSYQIGFIELETYFDEGKLSEEKTFSFFDYGFKLICDGTAPEIVCLKLEMEKMKWIKDQGTSADDLQLIVLTEHLLHTIREGNIDLTEDLCRAIAVNKRREISQIYDTLNR